MTTREIVETVRVRGGFLELQGEHIVVRLPVDSADLLPLLREQKPALLEFLQRQVGSPVNGGSVHPGWHSPSGEVVYSMPCCPRCGSYYLWRLNARTDFECQTCELYGISEAEARQAGARRRQAVQ